MKEYDKELLRSLVKQGLTNRKIAEKMGLTQTQVQYRITADGLVGIRREGGDPTQRKPREPKPKPKEKPKGSNGDRKNARPVNGVQDIRSVSVTLVHSINFPEVITAQPIIAQSTKKANR